MEPGAIGSVQLQSRPQQLLQLLLLQPPHSMEARGGAGGGGAPTAAAGAGVDVGERRGDSGVFAGGPFDTGTRRSHGPQAMDPSPKADLEW